MRLGPPSEVLEVRVWVSKALRSFTDVARLFRGSFAFLVVLLWLLVVVLLWVLRVPGTVHVARVVARIVVEAGLLRAFLCRLGLLRLICG
jgi:hypothetical protein